MRKRITKLGKPPAPVHDAVKQEAFSALFQAKKKLSEDMPYRGREQWLERCAEGRPTPEDSFLLDQLPRDALEAAGLTAIQYAAVATRLDREY